MTPARKSEYKKVKEKYLEKEFSFYSLKKEIRPENVLQKMTDHVQKYTVKELQALQLKNTQLMTSYNQLSFRIQSKTMILEKIQKKLFKSEESSKYVEEFKNKLASTQTEMEKAYEKLNKAEVEQKRLEQVITACFKNQARNDDWIRGLERAIENMQNMKKYTQDEIKQYKKDIKENQKEIQELQKAIQNKQSYQFQTIEKVAEQFILRTSLKENLVQGERRRDQIVNNIVLPHVIAYYKQKQKERLVARTRVQEAKDILRDKLFEYKMVFAKIADATGVNDPLELNNLITFLEKTEELKQKKRKAKEKKKALKQEKESLEQKLNFLKEDRQLLGVKEQDNVSSHDVVEKLLSQIQVNEGICSKTSYKHDQIIKVRTNAIASVEHIRTTLKLKSQFSEGSVDEETVRKELFEIENKLIFMLKKVQESFGTSNFKEFRKLHPYDEDIQSPTLQLQNQNIRVRLNPERESHQQDQQTEEDEEIADQQNQTLLSDSTQNRDLLRRRKEMKKQSTQLYTKTGGKYYGKKIDQWKGINKEEEDSTIGSLSTTDGFSRIGSVWNENQ